MAVESIKSQINRDTLSAPKLDNPQIIEQLRHGNIHEVLRKSINPEDINKFISFRGKVWENSILQNYQVYESAGSIPPPDLESIPPHSIEMSLSSEDRGFFREEMGRFSQARAMTGSARANVDGGEAQGPGQDVMQIAGEALQDWEEFFGEFQNRMFDAQMFQQMQAKGEELNREVERAISLVLQGLADPEYVLVAAAKSYMAQNGILFTNKGKKIMRYNEEQTKATKELLKMDPSDPAYFRELQMSQTQARTFATNTQLEMMDIQRVAQNISTAIEFASGAVRTFGQMRQTPTQAIAAR